MNPIKPGTGNHSVASPPGQNYRDTVTGDDSSCDDFQPLTRQEAQALLAKQPAYSPWRIVAAQSVVGLLLAVALTVFGGIGWGVSAAYGVAVVVVPGAVMVWGLKRWSASHPGVALVRFAVWEAAKLLLAVAMMAAAPKLINDLSWMIFLSALVVCLKVNWAVLFFDNRRTVRRAIDTLKRDGKDVC